MLRTTLTLAALSSVLATGVAAAASSFPATIQLPPAWQPEGIEIRGTTFYVGSIPTGSIYRGNLRTGAGEVFIQRTGRAAIGIELDRRNRLFVAGGNTGKAFVYNARTRATLPSTRSTLGFINDVVVTRTGAYFTELAPAPRSTASRSGTAARSAQSQTIPLDGRRSRQPPTGFNANGIDATPNGRWLIIVQIEHGQALPRQPDDRRDGRDRARPAGRNVQFGDGILLDGNRRLYVVQNQLNRIAVIQSEPGADGRAHRDATSLTRASRSRRRSTISGGGSTPSTPASARRPRRPTTRSSRCGSRR